MSVAERQYVIDFHREHLAGLDLAGRRVLEIGCGDGGLLTRLLREHPDIEELVGVNYPAFPTRDLDPRARVLEMDAADLDLPDAAFDLVYSLATFEHVHDLAGALREIERVLAPGGLLVAKWSPIWSGFDGHHYGPTLSWTEHRAIALPWAHLIFDRDTLPDYLARGEGFSRDEARTATERIYDSDWLNRRTAGDYHAEIERCGLAIEALDAVPCELGGLLAAIGRKVTAGVVEAPRVARFFRGRDDQELLTYKMIARLRKNGVGSHFPGR